MERLTERNENGQAYYKGCFDSGAPCGGGSPGHDFSTCDRLTAQCEHLAAYEDSGLTPERAAELGKADAEGRVYTSKYPIGTEVWVADDRVRHGVVRGVTRTSAPMSMIAMDNDGQWGWYFDRCIYGTCERADREKEGRKNMRTHGIFQNPSGV